MKYIESSTVGLGLSLATVTRALKNLLELGVIVRVGNGKSTRYRIQK